MRNEEQLLSLFSSEVQSLRNLLAILLQEHNALTKTDIGALETATTTKNQALRIQADATKVRRTFIANAFGLQSDDEVKSIIDSCDNSQELTALYTELTTTAKQCHEANRLNGRLIAEKHQQTLRALNVIRQTDNNMPTYSSHGKTTAGSVGKSLGKA